MLSSTGRLVVPRTAPALASIRSLCANSYERSSTMLSQGEQAAHCYDGSQEKKTKRIGLTPQPKQLQSQESQKGRQQQEQNTSNKGDAALRVGRIWVQGGHNLGGRRVHLTRPSFGGPTECRWFSSGSRKAGIISRHSPSEMAAREEAEKEQYFSGLQGAELEIRTLQVQLQDHISASELDKAKEIALMLQDMVASHFGESHPVYASTVNNLGMVYRLAQDWEKAIEAYSEAVNVYREAIGERHINTAIAIENHAHAFKSLALGKKGMERIGLLESSKRLFEEVLEIKTASLGDDNVQVGMTMQNLGSVLRLIGTKSQDARATELIEQGAAKVQKFLPFKHAAVGTALNNLALDLKRRKEFESALGQYSRALEARQAVLGEAHPDSIITMHNIAELLIAMGKDQEAAEIQSRILEIVGYEEEDSTPSK